VTSKFQFRRQGTRFLLYAKPRIEARGDLITERWNAPTLEVGTRH